MRDLRQAQLAHKTVTGTYEKDFDKLVRFIDTAEFTITQRRDTTVLDEEKTKRFRVDTFKEIVVIDTLGTRPVKNSLFKGSDRYKTMINVPVEGVTAKYTMDAGQIEKSNTMYPVFLISVKKDVLLADQPKDYVAKEKQIVSVDGVNGDALTVGSMETINTNGNWPKSYGAND
jgi:preprotein translocase subunit SecA